MTLCVCDIGGGNLGRPGCFSIFDVTKQIVLVNYLKSDGSVNGIQLSALSSGVLDQTYLDERVKDVDPDTRWYPSPELKSVVDERADDITEDFEDTSSTFVSEGARSFEGLILKGDPILLGNLQQWRCLTTGVFLVDKSGNLIGDRSRDGYLDPILLQEDSFSAGLIKGTDTTKQKNRVRFVISQLMQDSNLGMIEAANITANLLGVRGLIDVVAETPTAVTTAGFTVQLNTTFGGVTSPVPAEGLELADFEANEISPTPGVESIASVTESSTTPGEYAFVWTAPVGSGDVHRISNPSTGPLTKNYDLTAFNVTTP